MRKLLLSAVGSAAIVGTAHAELVITEIHYNPNGSESGVQEWIEIYNNSANPLDLSGFRYADIQDWNNAPLPNGNVSEPFAAGTIVPAFSAAVIVNQSAAEFQQMWGNTFQIIPYVSGTGGGISLANTGSATNETVAILDGALAVVDQVNYETTTNGWPAPNGMTVYLTPGNISQTGNDIGSSWALSVDGVDGAYTAAVINPGIGNATAPDVGSPGVVVVPEPASVGLLALASVTLIRRRRA